MIIFPLFTRCNLKIKLFVLPEILCPLSIWTVSWTSKQLHYKLVTLSTIPRQVSFTCSEFHSQVLSVQLWVYTCFFFSAFASELQQSLLVAVQSCVMLWEFFCFYLDQRSVINLRLLFYSNIPCDIFHMLVYLCY